MTRVTIQVSSSATTAFLVEVKGALAKPRDLNNALGKRLAEVLQAHFRVRNEEPNNLNAPKTGFWENVAANTVLGEVTDAGATVNISPATHLRIHLLGGVIKPTGGRKFLTIPLVADARGKTVRNYETETGRKLFRLGGSRVLMERNSDHADRSLLRPNTAGYRKRSGYGKITVRAGTPMRAVYALKESVTIPKDPRALPPQEQMAAALNETANEHLARILRS